MIFEFTLNGKTFKYDPEEEAKIDLSNLNECLAQHPGKVAFIGAVSALFKTMLNRKEAELERLYAILDAQIRANYAEGRGGKLTEKAIESLIYTNDEYIALKEETLNILEKSRLADSALEALRHRQFALVALVGMYKTEFTGSYVDMIKGG